MGARCTFVFKQSNDLGVALYSHWGEDSMNQDLALALQHAAKRKGDESYYVRMAISFLLNEGVMEETGFGLYACNTQDLGFMDHPIIINLTNNTVEDDTGIHDIDSFIEYHIRAIEYQKATV
jgi:hypothetical protein